MKSVPACVGASSSLRRFAKGPADADLARSKAPMLARVPPAERKRAVWVQPRLRCEVAYSEITAAGELRHPSFKGMLAHRGDS